MRGTPALWIVAATCSGCGMEIRETAGDEPPAGEVGEGLGGYSDKFAIPERQRVGPTTFHVAQGGAVNAEVKSSSWQSTGGFNCKGGLGMLLLAKRSPSVDLLKGKTFYIGRPGQKVAWSGLAAGDYDMTLDAINDNLACTLTGQIAFTATP